ncbi:MAG TPA: outer membrane beta-barrel protein [Flavisolibacter sp.]|nr:outer membrane beta-barrel protein [Flavisolibacter sp.]
MKKSTHLIVALLFISSASFAQITKGSVLIGGNIYFSNVNYDTGNPTPVENKSKSFSIAPSIGFATKENTIFGFGVFYSHSSQEQPNTEQNSNGYGGSLFLRRYMTLGKGFYLFGEGTLSGGTSQTKYINSSVVTNKSTGLGIGLGLNPGVSYAVNKKMHLEVGLNNLVAINYNRTKVDDPSVPQIPAQINKSFSAGINAGSSAALFLGLRFLFAK